MLNKLYTTLLRIYGALLVLAVVVFSIVMYSLPLIFAALIVKWLIW